MKRIICLILVFSFLLSGCTISGVRIKDPVSFHYLCDHYQEKLCCVIASEQREASGHVGDLSYLLALYLMGPVSEEMHTPLPAGTRIDARLDGNHVYLELMETDESFSDIDFSLACACLTLTTLDITGAEDVTIRCGELEKTLNRTSISLTDITDVQIPTEDTQ